MVTKCDTSHSKNWKSFEISENVKVHIKLEINYPNDFRARPHGRIIVDLKLKISNENERKLSICGIFPEI